ncbi:MAG TPA: hypothetical protein VHL11_20000, partial [Phototrophicaceae bacterium]|nr:hypothetical protein [Phototrophicaceae bacterium]
MKLKSWELWYSLFHHPLVYSPLFKNYARHPAPVRPVNLSERVRGLIFTAGLVLAGVLCLANLTIILRVLSGLIAFVIALLFMLSAILPGLNLALKVSAAIYSEQAKGRYDLLALTPRGAPALHWSLVMRCIKDDLIARRLREVMIDFASMFIIPAVSGLVTATVIAILMILFDFYAAVEFFAIVSVPLLLLLTVYSDYIQSTVIAALISIIVPAYMYTRSGFWMSWAAPLIF